MQWSKLDARLHAALVPTDELDGEDASPVFRVLVSSHDPRQTPHAFPARWSVDRLSDAVIAAQLSVDGVDELSEEPWVDSISLSGTAYWHVGHDHDEPESPPGGPPRTPRR
jgi:hypothetical protein